MPTPRDTFDMFIGGTWTVGDADDVISVTNPATDDEIATVPDGTAADVDDAVEAARRALEEWRWTDPSDRGTKLFELADRIEAQRDDLAALETDENGKPLDQSYADVDDASALFRYFGGAADKFYSDTVRHSPTEVMQKVFEPYGVVGIVIPWNWPPKHTADFTAIALATGNTVVLKPAPETPLSSLRIAELAADVLPDGVFNVVPGGAEPGIALSSHEDVDMLAFTGNDETGEQVLASAATNITPTMLELGGKNPAVVFPDADINRAIGGVLKHTFYNSGQACSNSERILVHEDVFGEFVDGFERAVEDLTVGDGRDDETQIGPMANRAQVEKVSKYLDLAEQEGADVLAQAELPTDQRLEGGFWAPPTALVDVTPSMRIMQEEVFGPVTGILPFGSEEEALDVANGTEYGLAAYVWTEDVQRAHRMSSRLEAGVVAVNGANLGRIGLPFGGYGRSGIGRKKDFEESMRAFTQVKSISMDLSQESFTL